MKVTTITVGAVQTNCYIAYHEETKKGFLVDPGDNAKGILRTIAELGVVIEYIFLTHSHFDHVLALAEVAEGTGAKIAIHKLEADEIQRPSGETLRKLGLPAFTINPVKVDILLKDADVLECAGERLTILHTPGHTVGSICIDTGDLLFSGDTLFEDDCGRCDLPGGDYGVMLKSLYRLSALTGDRRVYPGHDVATTLARERKMNRDMREAMRAVHDN